MSLVADGDIIELPRDTRRVRALGRVDWANNMGEGATQSREYHRRDMYGNASGHWIMAGTGATKKMYRDSYNGMEAVQFGVPKLGFRYEGWPGKGYDQHVIVVQPDGTIHQGINYRKGAVQLNFFGLLLGQADFWKTAVFTPGELQKPEDESAGTASGYSLAAYARALSGQSGASGLLVADYQGADGQLTSGPRCGDRLVVPRHTESYRRNVALGGVCAQWAEDDATYGTVIGDRSGYMDIDGRQDYVGEEPKPATFWVQTGRQWQHTNAHLYSVDMTDFYYAEFDDGVIEPDPRVALVEAAHEQFDDVIHELGLSAGDTKYLVGMNDQTMGEAIRLIENKGGRDG